MADYEKDIKDLIAKMHQQQSGGMPGGSKMLPPGEPGTMPSGFQQHQDPGMNPDQSPHLMSENAQGSNNPDQSPVNPINSVRPMGTPINNAPPQAAGMTIAGDGCPQCGMSHPPIQPGQKCPMAGVKQKDEKGVEKTVDVNKFLTDLKNIIVSQSDQKGIKDIEKLFKNIIVEVTKYIEGYSE